MSGDHRFDSMHTAPIFKQSKKDSFKVKVDDRFKSVLSDTRFQSVPGKVDKYGRKTKTKDGANKVVKELKEFYDIDGDDNETAVPEHQQTSNKPSKPHGGSMDSRLDYLNKLARGEISEESSSDDSSEAEDESESSDESDQSDDDLVAQQQGSSSRKSALAIPEQPEPELSADVSSTRVAIQNCDWENLSAEDIMYVLTQLVLACCTVALIGSRTFPFPGS